MLNQRIRREEIDTGQYPEPFDFTTADDAETEVSVKEGFSFNPVRLGKWRFYVETDILYVEHFDGSAWIEEARFEA